MDRSSVISRWSGKVSCDEKWINITGVWYVVLCAFDAVGGLPLLLDLHPTSVTVS